MNSRGSLVKANLSV